MAGCVGSPFCPATHVIFDFDGLVLDTERKYEEAIYNICKRYERENPLEPHESLESKFNTIGRSPRDGAEVVIKHFDLPISVDLYLQEIEAEYNKVFEETEFMPGAERLIRHLSKNGIPIALATTCKRTSFERKAIRHQEVFDLFDVFVFGSDDEEITAGKPATDIFKVAAKRFDPQPETPKNVLVFEDSAAGVIAGLTAGMQVVWVPDPSLDSSKLSPTLLLKSLEDFEPALFSLPIVCQSMIG